MIIKLLYYILLFYYIKLTYQANSIQIPPIYAGGCQLLNDQVYYLGGTRKFPDPLFNRVIYRLSLTQSFQSASPNWYLENTDQLAPSILYPNLVELNQKLYVRGGLYTPINEAMKLFNIGKNQWEIDKEASLADIVGLYYNSNQLDDALKYTEYLSTFTKVDSSSAILLGGYIDSPTRNNSANLLVTQFDAATNNWKKLPIDGQLPSMYDHATLYNNNKLYSLGGMAYPSNERIPMDKLTVYNLNNSKIEFQPLIGEIPSPRMGHQFLELNKTHWILLGGASWVGSNNFTTVNDTFLLNTNNFEWIKINIDNFIPTYRGCAFVFNNQLISTLGYSIPFKNDTQIIDLSNLKLKSSFEPKETKKNYNLEIGLSIGIPLFIIFIIIIALYYYFKIRRYDQHSFDSAKWNQTTNYKPYSSKSLTNPSDQVEPIIEPIFIQATLFSNDNTNTLQEQNSIINQRKKSSSLFRKLSNGNLFKFNELELLEQKHEDSNIEINRKRSKNKGKNKGKSYRYHINKEDAFDCGTMLNSLD